ncbi:NADPH:quinone oxidoreductase family protein [Alkalilacustris brevis]|uniref:NADPH:quinone oxidoreductase family protein n=1 Tax=Alkalilacustris brevis TaxID=2026338 RepID=UPI001EE47168|nr:NADPH:quinone oxidoreductase family protein [Alkalilacustris brevis]
MKRIVVEATGAPPRLTDGPEPSPGPGEVALRVRACGLNFADLLMIAGAYQERPEPPFTPGMEVAGEVIATGPGTDTPAPGSRVLAFLGQGGLAETVIVPAAHCLPLPDGMSFAVAAGFPVAYGTSHLALTHKARLAPGETLLVLGAAGGVGLTAVEIGRQLGARVIGCARGADHLAAAERAGAHHLIDSEAGDLRAALKALGGVDVVYDPVGGALFREAMRATRPGGRLLIIGFASGDVPQIPANHLLVKNIDALGFYWGGYLRFAPERLNGSLAELMRWYGEGRLKPHVGHTLPLERTAEALDLLRQRKSTGKVVITLSGV